MIERIYDTLKKEHFCASAYDFSERFLGKSKSYYSVIKTRHSNPSIDAIITLENVLQRKASLLPSDNPIFARGKRLLSDLHADVSNYKTVLTAEKINSSFLF